MQLAISEQERVVLNAENLLHLDEAVSKLYRFYTKAIYVILSWVECQQSVVCLFFVLRILRRKCLHIMIVLCIEVSVWIGQGMEWIEALINQYWDAWSTQSSDELLVFMSGKLDYITAIQAKVFSLEPVNTIIQDVRGCLRACEPGWSRWNAGWFIGHFDGIRKKHVQMLENQLYCNWVFGSDVLSVWTQLSEKQW